MEIDELVTKAKTGDQQAFADVYDLFAERIFRFIRLKVSDSLQAEDILQETFIKAWQGLPKLNIRELNFSAWLYKIARNLIIDSYRKNSKVQISEIDENMPDDKIPKMAETFDQKLSNQDLKKSLQNLSEQYRTIIELRYVQDFSIAETARILNKTNLAVRLATHRAIKQLKGIMKNNEIHQ